MTMECRNCHAQYEAMQAGDFCPECGAINKPFRSTAARTMLELEEAPDRYFGERHQECIKSRDPLEKATPLRRVAPTLRLLALALAVATLGRFMIEAAQHLR